MTFFTDTAVRIAYHLLKGSGDTVSDASMRRVGKMLEHTRRLHRHALLQNVVKATGNAVIDGPFEGLELGETSCTTDPYIGAKLLGFYEREIQDLLAGWQGRAIDGIVNVGSGNGFFTMGSALLLKPDHVWAVDISEPTLNECRENFSLNGLTAGAEFLPTMEGGQLAEIARATPNLLIISDCEGYERQLFDPKRVADLARAHLIIECHDFAEPNITEDLSALFSPTHALSIIHEGPRDPNSATVLRGLSSADRWLAISEDRPETMHWLIAEPR